MEATAVVCSDGYGLTLSLVELRTMAVVVVRVGGRPVLLPAVMCAKSVCLHFDSV